jgi:excinuclease ABC subunit B
VEYFVSYYDYYQPEAYVPRTDTYIEKESSINEQIDRMRHSATRALLERDDVIIVASVSCIYGIGSVETYTAMTFQLTVGRAHRPAPAAGRPGGAAIQAQRQAFQRGTFRVRGDTVEVFPAHLRTAPGGSRFFGDEIEASSEFDPLTGHKSADLESVKIYANSHYVTPRPTLNQADQAIKAELKSASPVPRRGPLLEAQRLEQRTQFDIEMLRPPARAPASRTIRATSPAARPASRRPPCSNTCPTTRSCSSTRATSPCRRSAACSAATSTARRRWPNTASACPPASTTGRCASRNGTRCARRPSHVSATPGAWEMERTGGVFAEQVIRPTGLIDPPVEIRPAPPRSTTCSPRCATAAKGYRTLVTVLTKRMAEDLTEYMHEQGVRVRYMHSDIDTLERIEIIRDLRLGAFDVLVGINLLREGLDIPECALVAILDADKEGFLRSETSLIQTIGRAARNVDGRVLLYADKVTGSMQRAMDETDRRRAKQEGLQRGARHHAGSVKKNIADILDSVYERDHVTAPAWTRRKARWWATTSPP